MSHVHTPEWQSFELRMRERARAHRAARRKRQMRRASAWTGGALLAAGVWIGARAASPFVRPAALFERGASYLDAGAAYLDAGATYLDTAAAYAGAGIASGAEYAAAAGGRAAERVLRLEEYAVDLYVGARGTSAPAVRRPGQPFTPRDIVLPPLPAPLLEHAEAPPPPSAVTVADAAPAPRATVPVTRAATPPPSRADVEPAQTGSLESRISSARLPSPPAGEAAAFERGPDAARDTTVATAGQPAAPSVLTSPEPSPLEPAALPPPATSSPPAASLRAPSAASTSTEAAEAAAPETSGDDSAAVARVVDQQSAIRGVIERYRSAYERLDAPAARQVWPAVEEAALARAFGSLSSQRLTFDECAINVSGSSALATCRGTARVVPRVGGGSEAARRAWTFWLRQTGDRWFIERTEIRPRN